jgi:hypothetical protein
MLGIAMTKVILNQPQVIAAISQREAAGMAKHVRMDWRQAGASGRLCEEIVHRLTRERSLTFGDKQLGQRICAASQVSLDGAEFIAGDGMFHIQPALQAPDPQTSEGKVT